MELQELRALHPQFTYRSFDYQVVHGNLEVSWQFELEPDSKFTPRLVLSDIPVERWQNLPQPVKDTLIFHLGLIEMPSYWKATCSPKIVIEAGQLSAEQINWWRKIFLKGLGEFYYLNQIDFTAPDFLTIQISDAAPSFNQPYTEKLTQSILVPIGGGKDSAVSIELLKQSEFHLQPWGLNPIPATERTVEQAGWEVSSLWQAHRTIDPELIRLNQVGYLNGHTPFSAYVAFLTTLVSVVYDVKYVAVSNEASANECNTIFHGMEINHQYSKTYEFESDFRTYCHQYLSIESEYFSLLRPLHELQIAKQLADYPNYLPVIRSCNVGQKTDTWCHHCPKCLFTFVMLFPFVPYEVLIGQVFSVNLFSMPELTETAWQLINPDQTKPFECVGSYQESQLALWAAIEYYHQQGIEPPTLLKTVKPWLEAKNAPGSWQKEFETILSSWNEQHHLPDSLETIVKKVLITNKNMAINPLSFLKQVNKIMIVGLGKEGLSNWRFAYDQNWQADYCFADEKPLAELHPEWQTILGEHANCRYLQLGSQSTPQDVELVIKTPGIPEHFLKEKYHVSTQETTSNTELFFAWLETHPNRITSIGITGTKGKSTTTSLIAHTLETSNQHVVMGGNIGHPALDLIPELEDLLAADQNQPIYTVLELSSHQLAELHYSPQIAVIQGIVPEHLDYYASFEEYVAAKSHITQYQTSKDLVIYAAESETATQLATQSAGQKIGFKTAISSNKDKPQTHSDTLVWVSDDTLYFGDQELCPLSTIKLKGNHNLLNIAPALIIADLLQLPTNQIVTALQTFTPLPHRLELVGNYNQVEYYNDSLATNPKATIGAIQAFSNQPIILIAGGFDRHQEFDELGKVIAVSPVNHVILFPTTGQRIQAAVEAALQNSTKKIAFYSANSMADAISYSAEHALPGQVVLLSPAAASFGMFKDYADRGNQFREAVKALIGSQPTVR